MRKFLTTSIIISAVAFAAYAQNNAVIAERQEIMETNGKDMKALSAMAKGETAFDAATALQMLQQINAGAKQLPNLFPDDSKTGTGADGDATEAAPAIWEKRAEFDAEVQKFIGDTDAAVAAAPQDAASLGAAIQMFAGDCKACHETFRVKKN